MYVHSTGKILRKTIGNYSVPIPTLGVGGHGCRVEGLGFRVYVVGVASLQKTLSIWGSHLGEVEVKMCEEGASQLMILI